MNEDIFTPEVRTDAEIWMAVGFHLDQAIGMCEAPAGRGIDRQNLLFHLSEVKRQLKLVNDEADSDGE